MEYLLPLAVSFGLTVVSLPFFIQYLSQRQFGQTTREEGPTWHEAKSGTPTMGGTVFLLVILLVLMISAWLLDLISPGFWMLWLSFLGYGIIGFLDDFISIFKHQNEGLTARQKFLAQLGVAALVMAIGLWQGLPLQIPLGFTRLVHPLWLLPFGVVWITGFSNAVNLSDGLDGLATGLNILSYGAYFFLAMQAQAWLIALTCFVVIGALMGFLYYNFPPAKIFMGDVGSLALGAGLAVISLLLENPWSLLILGLVFVIETLSVILQVVSFKTRGKRLFKMSPIHHHFEMLGWSEKRVVYSFWALGALASLVYTWLMKG